MHNQQQRPQPLTVPHDEPAQSPLSPWQRPSLERLHVSLDTAADTQSNADGGIGSLL